MLDPARKIRSSLSVVSACGVLAAMLALQGLAPQSAAAQDMPKIYKAGALTIEAPWTRATPGGAKVASGYMRIVNGGKEPDRLTGATLEGAAGEVHEMKTEDGIMRMRPLEKGLEIAPGAAAELSPGGYHVMFMGLANGLKQGERIKGTLVFEKAGVVPVEFVVTGIGASGGPGQMLHH